MTENNTFTKLLFSLLISIACLTSCSLPRYISSESDGFDVKLDTVRLFDDARNREIPIAIYRPVTTIKSQEIVIFNHGYGANYQKNYLVYSYITKHLASQGYFVVSIQHELPTDSLLPFSGDPQVVRLPFWERGSENIMFTINELKKFEENLNYNRITLIGHSNGGDMCALFPQLYPDVIAKIITLDHLRVPLPLTKNIKVYSLRSSDKEADLGVLPSSIEQNKFGIEIIKLKNIDHNDMNDFAKKKQKKVIRQYIDNFMQH